MKITTVSLPRNLVIWINAHSQNEHQQISNRASIPVTLTFIQEYVDQARTLAGSFANAVRLSLNSFISSYRENIFGVQEFPSRAELCRFAMRLWLCKELNL